MRWFEVTVTTSLEMVDWIADVFHANGADGVAIEDSEVMEQTYDSIYGVINGLNPDDYPAEGARIKGYIHDGFDLEDLEQQLVETLARWKQDGTDVGDGSISRREVVETDWATAWQDYYHPVKVSERIGIAPTWEPFEEGTEPEIVIKLDPGMAFGTGTHATTTLCMQLLEQIIHGAEQVADVGTGTAILAISAIKLGAAHVVALDLDPVAIESAERNCAENTVSNQVTIIQNEMGIALETYGAKPDVLVANLLAEIIVALAGDFSAWIKPGGRGIFSGIIENKKAVASEALEQNGWSIVRVIREGDWIAMEAKYM